MKEALTETLVRKMRAAFAGDGDALAEDIVGEEVVAFMTHNGSTRASEIEALEARIAARLETERGANGSGNIQQQKSIRHDRIQIVKVWPLVRGTAMVSRIITDPST